MFIMIRNVIRYIHTVLIFTVVIVSACDNSIVNSAKNTRYYEPADFVEGTIDNNPGNLKWYFYVPEGMKDGEARPLVVAMHACTQTAFEFNERSGWTSLADRFKFYLVFPEQKGENSTLQCFSWNGDQGNMENMDPVDIIRAGAEYEWYGHGVTTGNGGESASIVNMVKAMETAYSISKVYATGLSAGGFMTTILLAVYPDVFSAGSIMSGGPYLCGFKQLQPLYFDGISHMSCLGSSQGLTSEEWGNMVLSYSKYSKPADIPWPRVQVWHGGDDAVVVPANMDKIVAQWAYLHGASSEPTEISTLKGYVHNIYAKEGTPVIETIFIDNMHHTLSIDPGTGDDQGGTLGIFSEDHGIWSTYYAAKFFGLVGK